MGQRIFRSLLVLSIVVAVVLVAWKLDERLSEDDESGGATARRERPAAPVEVAAIRRGKLVLRRTFSGTLEAPASFVVAPKVAGRIAVLSVDIGDEVRRGSTVASLDDAEFVQAKAQAAADVAVAEANLEAAKSALLIADRELERIETLNARGVVSDTQLDTARASQLSKQADVAVATAQVKRANAALLAAGIRLGYAQVVADWTGGDEYRVVGERFVSEGSMVSANAPMLRIVELDPITAAINVVERDYAKLRIGQTATLVTDALPDEPITGEVVRIAPVFRSSTRQARVELSVKNEDGRLKPGMFVRATAALDEVVGATIVPRAALTSRSDRLGVFVVDEAAMVVRWCPVRVGIREGEEVAVEPNPMSDDEELPPLSGRVVILGQELVDDGSAIAIPADDVDDGSRAPEAGVE